MEYEKCLPARYSLAVASGAAKPMGALYYVKTFGKEM